MGWLNKWSNFHLELPIKKKGPYLYVCVNLLKYCEKKSELFFNDLNTIREPGTVLRPLYLCLFWTTNGNFLSNKSSPLSVNLPTGIIRYYSQHFILVSRSVILIVGISVYIKIDIYLYRDSVLMCNLRKFFFRVLRLVTICYYEL